MKYFLMALTCAAVGCGTTHANPSPPAPSHAVRSPRAPLSTPPSPRDAIAALGAHADLEATDVSCHGVAGDDITLGGIEAHLLGQLAEAHAGGDPASLIAHCEGEQAPWSCVVGVRIDIDDPWDYRITFHLDASGAIDAASIRCPGAA